MYSPILTTEDFNRRIEVNVTEETETLEFKARLEGFPVAKGTALEIKKHAQLEVCRDVTQFANWKGGTLLFGVAEHKQENGRAVVQSLNGVQNAADCRQWIEQALAKYCVPLTFSRTIETIQVDTHSVVAVNVPPSRSLVALWNSEAHTIQYISRTSHGKRYLNPDEVDRMRQDNTRSGQVAMEMAQSSALSIRAAPPQLRTPLFSRLGSTLERMQPELTKPTVGALRAHDFEIRVRVDSRQLSAYIPYGVVREAWADDNGDIHVLLGARLVLCRGNAFTLEPFR